jgi:hypothetical protein
MRLLHLYADELGDKQLSTTDIPLPLKVFAPPATPFIGLRRSM